MSNAVVQYEGAPALPADIAAFIEEHKNITPPATIPTLTYEGKVWAISVNGERTKITRKNADGDREPVSVMKVVVLDYNKQRGRAYYQGAYDPAKTAMPLCWSDDGVTPSPTIREPQSDRCATCPMSAKGSKVTEQNKQVTACSEHRMLVVVPANSIGYEPLRLKIAITSDYDGRSPDEEANGWFAFKNYTDMLVTRGVGHTLQIVTKIKFDQNVAYPKLFFSQGDWLDPETKLRESIEAYKNPKVKQLLSGSWTPNGVDGVAITDQSASSGVKAVTAAPAQVAPTAAAAPLTSPTTAAPKAATAPKAAAPAAANPKAAATAAATAAAAAKAAKKRADVDAAAAAAAAAAAETEVATNAAEDDEDGMELPGVAEKTTAAKPSSGAKGAPAAPAQDDAALDDLMSEWA